MGRGSPAAGPLRAPRTGSHRHSRGPQEKPAARARGPRGALSRLSRRAPPSPSLRAPRTPLFLSAGSAALPQFGATILSEFERTRGRAGTQSPISQMRALRPGEPQLVSSAPPSCPSPSCPSPSLSSRRYPSPPCRSPPPRRPRPVSSHGGGGGRGGGSLGSSPPSGKHTRPPPARWPIRHDCPYKVSGLGTSCRSASPLARPESAGWRGCAPRGGPRPAERVRGVPTRPRSPSTWQLLARTERLQGHGSPGAERGRAEGWRGPGPRAEEWSYPGSRKGGGVLGEPQTSLSSCLLLGVLPGAGGRILASGAFRARSAPC